MVVCNGDILAQAPQFDVQVITATIDLDDDMSYRAAIPSLGPQAKVTDRHELDYKASTY